MTSRNHKILGWATFANFALMNWVYKDLPGGGISIIQLQFAFTTQNAQKILDLWGPFGQQLFTSTLYLDYVFPVLYGCLLYLRAKNLSQQKTIKLIAIIAPLADCLENTLHFGIIKLWWPINYVFLASLAASLKWGCILIVLLSPFFKKAGTYQSN